jgi:hypothetical protein
MKQDTIESLKKQEEELEKLMMNAPVEGETTPSAAVKEPVEQKEAPTGDEGTVIPPTQSAPDDNTEPEKDQEDWKLRYTNLRSSRDQNLYKAKRDLAAAQQMATDLQNQITSLRTAQPKVDPLEGVFTDEDTDALGEATITAMRKATAKATEAATKPLQEQLEAERLARIETTKQTAESTKREAYDIFLSRVARAVPDWETVNYDPEFTKFMDAEDLDGTPRKTYFADAEAQGNAAQVIRYMQEFKAQKPAPPKDKLADKVTPVGDDAGATQPKQPGKTDVVTRAFINKFYDDLSRGRYKGKYTESQEIEAMIDKATTEGRIR